MKDEEKIAYMLYGDEDGTAYGQFFGVPRLDFTTLSVVFRTERFAKAEAAQEDFCFIDDHDFIAWLFERGILSHPPVAPVSVTIRIDDQGKNRYAPKHWPSCPECETGRGQDTSGDVVRQLNRWEWHLTCIECGHIWGHRAEPYDSKKPLIEDDGRMTHNGCVPYSISRVGGLPMESVLEVCRAHGFSEEDGMTEDSGIEVMRALGLSVEPGRLAMVAGRLTLRRLLNVLSATESYIVATRRHWLAVVHGENCDQADTSMRAEVVGFWKILQASQTAN